MYFPLDSRIFSSYAPPRPHMADLRVPSAAFKSDGAANGRSGVLLT